MDYNEYLKRMTFTQTGIDLFYKLHKRAQERQQFISEALSAFDNGNDAFLEFLKTRSEEFGAKPSELCLYIHILKSEEAHEKYRGRGISDEVFFATMSDIPRNCEKREKYFDGYGMDISILYWFRLFFDLVLFRLGNLEFHYYEFDGEDIPKFGIKTGDRLIGVHIPTGIDFSPEKCREAYALARGFFKKYFNHEKCTFICITWLLHPWLSEVLSEKSSIVAFGKSYDIYVIEENPSAVLGWIFPGCDVRDLDALPQNTTMQRAAIKYLKEKRPIGIAGGILKEDF